MMDFDEIIRTGMLVGGFFYFNFNFVIPKVTDMIEKYFMKEQKEVVILRGVPGSGKDNFVYKNQLDRQSKYFVNINSDKEFYNNKNKYVFRREDINKHKESCLRNFIFSLKVGVPTIYINETNEKTWMYENYVILAKLFNYKVSIVEMICRDRDVSYYFNIRSKHNVPMKHSIKLYESFEYDNRSEYFNSNPQEYKKFLDNDIETFMKDFKKHRSSNKNFITESDDSDSDYSPDNSVESDSDDDYYISNQSYISKTQSNDVDFIKNYEINIIFLKNRFKIFIDNFNKVITRYIKV